MNLVFSWPTRFGVRLIQRYQYGGGGLRYFGIACNFEPTCSEYTKQAIIDRGLLRGCILGWQRIRRCQHKSLTDKISDPYPSTRSRTCQNT